MQIENTVLRCPRIELAIRAIATAVAIVALGLGALLPLAAALGIGFVAGWIGHVLNCHHLHTEVRASKVLGLIGTFAAAMGWLARLLLDSHHRNPEEFVGIWGVAVGLTVATLALACLREILQARRA